jgi:hypothetical protein
MLGGCDCGYRVQPDRRCNQHACTPDREQSPGATRPRSKCNRETNQSDPDHGDRRLRQEGSRTTRLGEAADRAGKRVITRSQQTRDRYGNGRSRWSHDSQRAGQSFHCRPQLRT